MTRTSHPLNCRHLRVTIVGSDETGARAARCADCGAALTRRIDGTDYVYVVSIDEDDARAAHGIRAHA